MVHRDSWVRMLFLVAKKNLSGSSFFVITAGCNLQEASIIGRHFHPSILEELKNKLCFLHSSFFCLMIQITSIKMQFWLEFLLPLISAVWHKALYLCFTFSEVRWIAIGKSEKTCNSLNSLGIICKIATFTDKMGERSSSVINVYGSFFLTQAYFLRDCFHDILCLFWFAVFYK